MQGQPKKRRLSDASQQRLERQLARQLAQKAVTQADSKAATKAELESKSLQSSKPMEQQDACSQPSPDSLLATVPTCHNQNGSQSEHDSDEQQDGGLDKQSSSPSHTPTPARSVVASSHVLREPKIVPPSPQDSPAVDFGWVHPNESWLAQNHVRPCTRRDHAPLPSAANLMLWTYVELK